MGEWERIPGWAPVISWGWDAGDAQFAWRGIPGARIRDHLEKCRGRGLGSRAPEQQAQNREGLVLTSIDLKTEISTSL